MSMLKAGMAISFTFLFVYSSSAEEKAQMVASSQTQTTSEAKQAPSKAAPSGPAVDVPEKECVHETLCRHMVPTADGGVFILIGNQLYKYDTNLALQKEVEIKANPKSTAAVKMDKEKTAQPKNKVTPAGTAMPAKPKSTDPQSEQPKKQ